MVFVGIAIGAGDGSGPSWRSSVTKYQQLNGRRRLKGGFCHCVKQIGTPLQLALRPVSRRHPFGLGSAQTHPVSRSAVAGG